LKPEYKKLACHECLNGAGLDFDFKMAFQPVVDSEERRIYSHEALVRGPQGESAASVMARVNEQNRYRFDQSCRVKAIEAAARFGLKTYLNINFIPGAIYNPLTCIRTTLEAAEEFSFDKSKIIFEVTEGERVTDHAHLKSIFAEYKKQGFQTAIDDFGAGYSGLNLLAEFQPDIIKLDMALIRNINTDRVRSIIVDAICHVCREIGIRVVAEGIESEAEYVHLQQKGIRYYQGYYFARPVFDGIVTEIPVFTP